MTPEQKQRIEQIWEQQNKHSALFDGNDSYKIVQRSEIRIMLNSIDDLLSLVKSQEAGGEFARIVAATIAADLGYQGGTRNQQALAATIETALNNFTTSMRSACVEKVREKISDLSRTSIAVEQNAITLRTLHALHNELESLSLQEQEK